MPIYFIFIIIATVIAIFSGKIDEKINAALIRFNLEKYKDIKVKDVDVVKDAENDEEDLPF